MKSFAVIALNLVLVCPQAYSQLSLDSKLDSLEIKLQALRRQEASIESEIEQVTAEINKLARLKLVHFRDTLVKAKCITSTCYIMAEPQTSAQILKKVDRDDFLQIDIRYFSNDYLKARHGNDVGYIYHGVLEKTDELNAILTTHPGTVVEDHHKESTTTVSQPDSNTYNAPPTGTYHNVQTGPRGGKYYINSKGKKTYVKKR